MHLLRGMKWLFLAAAMAIAIVGLWLVPQTRSDREEWKGGGGMVPSPSSVGTPVGTSGAHDGAAEDHRGDVITEIETITGTNDGMTLVGRRVDLQVDVQSRANDQAFWVGPRDNRLLVVLARDRRDARERHRARPSNHGISPVHGGQRATVAGVIRAVPQAERRYSWNLTRDDERELADRKIYIEADTVSSEGHGTGF